MAASEATANASIETAFAELDRLSLRHGAAPTRRTASDDYVFEERAAIMEHDGGLSRDAAERFARELISLGKKPSALAVASIDDRLSRADAMSTQGSKGDLPG